MRAYLAKRFLLASPTLLGISLLVFLIMRVVPGDVAMLILTGSGESSATIRPADIQGIRAQLGIDRPLHEQYLVWAWDMVHLEGGKSLWSGRPVMGEIARRFPVTLELAVLTIVISLLIAIPSGVISAARQDTWVDYLVRVLTIGGIAMPTFWVGTLIMMLLVGAFEWMPPITTSDEYANPGVAFRQLIWPALGLGYYLAASVSRMTRSTMLEVLRQDYVRTAWSKGLREQVVVRRHALKNALLPVITLSGIQFGHLLGGTVIMESIFLLPGLGTLLLQALLSRDYPVVQTLITLFAAVFILVNLAVDVTYAWLDPRIRYD